MVLKHPSMKAVFTVNETTILSDNTIIAKWVSVELIFSLLKIHQVGINSSVTLTYIREKRISIFQSSASPNNSGNYTWTNHILFQSCL